MPTILELSGGSRPETWQGRPVPIPPGRSLVPAFSRDDSVGRDYFYWYHSGNRAIRTGDWKLVSAGKDGPWELYDLAGDRSESNDLAARHPERVKQMAERWERCCEEFRRTATGGAAAETGGR